ncbi:hypothetical protein KIW84_074343 [Lathyrus oleraceus]|uniref:Uncharacterized protein n=1 Tax=Pisum sativum TaxID=3888 RepID=A0A9D4ZYG1_PEA|nr:hypothetical protein KIW84_074343 [Pisum sativum]
MACPPPTANSSPSGSSSSSASGGNSTPPSPVSSLPSPIPPSPSRSIEREVVAGPRVRRTPGYLADYVTDHNEGAQVTYSTQTSQSHQYQMSQETILSLTPVPDEDVGDDSDYEEARYVNTQNIFSGESDNSDNDIPVVHQDEVQDLYNPPLHMRNSTYSHDENASIFETTKPLRIEGGLLGMEFNSKEGCVLVIRQFHIRNCLDYSVYKSDSKRLIIKCVNEERIFKFITYMGKGSGTWVITK